MTGGRVEGLSNRELLDRVLIRVRRDLATIEQLARVVGINEEVPAEVADALAALERWTYQLLDAGRPGRPGRTRPKGQTPRGS
jgi:hypothetical protein